MFSAIFAKRNSFGHAYVASLNLAQHEIYSYGSNFFPLMLEISNNSQNSFL